jgi:enediyne biosynthesis protein E4
MRYRFRYQRVPDRDLQIRARHSRGRLKEASVMARISLNLTIAFTLAAVAAPTARITFEDIAARAGIAFVLEDSATPARRQIETMVGGVAIFDYNNDGKPDVYLANGARQPDLVKAEPAYYNRLYRNNGDGTFTDVTLSAGVRGEGFASGVAVADYDNDGWEDLFIAGVNRNILYRNRGDGTFEDVTTRARLGPQANGRKPWSVGAGWFDYDNDGRLDLFVVNYCAWDPETEHACSIGKARTYCHPKYYDGLPNSLYHNNGDGTFTDVSAASGIASHIGKGMAVSFLDFDGDGRMDAFVTNDTTPNALFRNLGNGRFEEVALEAGVAFNNDGRAVSSMGADARDIDNDGLEDIFVTANEGETFPLFRNLGRGLFADITNPSGVGRQSRALTGWSTGIFDFDNDGARDLFVANGAIDDNVEEFAHRPSRQRNLVLANLGSGKFDDVSAQAGADLQKAARHRGAAFGDLDGDGRVDVVVSRIGERAAVLRNTSPAGNHYLAVRLRGRRSNRDGLGAMVHITGASGRQQWNRVTTAVGYGSSSERTAFFGMGQDRTASIEVLWPSGVRQNLRNVACDRYLLLEEP